MKIEDTVKIKKCSPIPEVDMQKVQATEEEVLAEPTLDFWEGKTPCWEMFRCPEAIKNECPAFKYRTLPCWQIEGTYCKLSDYGQRGDNTDLCQVCQVYKRYGHSKPIQIKLVGKGIDTLLKKGEIGDAGRTFREIQEAIDRNKGKAGAVIRVLQEAQRLFGYLPAPIVKIISRDSKVPLSQVYGIISFYNFFSMLPKGKYVIQVCMCPSCYVKGSQRILDTLKKDWSLEPRGITPDGRFSLETGRCTGCCGLSPVMAIGEDVHRKVNPSQLKDILNSYR